MTDGTPQLGANAIRVLQRRYLARDADGRVIETPAQLFARVASVVARAEASYGADESTVQSWADRFERAMAGLTFLPNSPTLMNAGRPEGVLSACFVLPVDDSIEGIFESVKTTALIQKAGGGTGFAFDRLRPTGDTISSSGGTTSGPISFWRVFSEATNAIQQGAHRRGANMGMMDVTHPDVLRFITAKTALGAFENFNISIKVDGEFMRDVLASPRAPHVVVNPRTRKRYVIPRGVDVSAYTLKDLRDADGVSSDCWSIGEVWDLIVDSAHATGEPGLCFIDRINADNPTPALGRIEATNPCGEQPLLDYEACNLGSINVARFVDGDRFDDAGFGETVRLAVRFLDDVIDVNHYVVEPIRRRCLGNRKIGLGVMGLADALVELGIPYDSDEALAFADRLAGQLAVDGFSASEALARQRGSFPNHAESLWSTRDGRAMRNAAVVTVAPTGTISILAGCSGGIEPLFALAYQRTVMEGEKLPECHAGFRAAMVARRAWSDDIARRLASGEQAGEIKAIPDDLRRLFVTAHDVSPEMHVRMQAVFQKHLDGAISKTINLPADAGRTVVADVFRQAHRAGCKGITVYRHGCRPDQPMDYTADSPVRCPRCHMPMDAEAACSRCPGCGCTICS